MTARNINPFASYVKEHAEKGASIFVDSVDMTVVAVLNLGTPDAPGHADNKALLNQSKTAEFKAIEEIVKTDISQTKAAEFLEDWADNVKCFNTDGEVKLGQAIAAIRKITIESSRKQETSEQQLGSTKSAFESIQASSHDPLPTSIEFTCRPYADLDVRTFVMRVSVLTGDSKPKLVFRVQKAEQHDEQMAAELASKIRSEFSIFGSDGIPVLIGSYRKTD